MAVVLQPVGRWAPNRTLIRIPYQQIPSAPPSSFPSLWMTQNSGQDFRVRMSPELLEGPHWTGLVTVGSGMNLDELLTIAEAGTYSVAWNLPIRNWDGSSIEPHVAITSANGFVVHMPATSLFGTTIAGAAVSTARVCAMIQTTFPNQQIALRLVAFSTSSEFVEVLGASGGAAQLASGCTPASIEIERISYGPG